MYKTSAISLDSGKIKTATYSREDIQSAKRIKDAVRDIYTNLPDFNETITWVTKIEPNIDKTTYDVLKEYEEKYGKDSFVMLRTGELVSIASSSIDELSEAIGTMIMDAFNADFYRIIFNKCMSHSYLYRDICIYNNDKTQEWIDSNMGTDKIIKGIIASGSIN